MALREEEVGGRGQHRLEEEAGCRGRRQSEEEGAEVGGNPNRMREPGEEEEAAAPVGGGSRGSQGSKRQASGRDASGLF